MSEVSEFVDHILLQTRGQDIDLMGLMGLMGLRFETRVAVSSKMELRNEIVDGQFGSAI